MRESPLFLSVRESNELQLHYIIRLTARFHYISVSEMNYVMCETWGAANGGLRDGGLRKSEDIWGKRPFSSVFWIFQVFLAPSGKGRKRQKKNEKGRFRPISGRGGQTPLKPPFVTPPFAAAQKPRVHFRISYTYTRNFPRINSQSSSCGLCALTCPSVAPSTAPLRPSQGQDLLGRVTLTPWKSPRTS